jgi:predicted O-methyltransferase YrrM
MNLINQEYIDIFINSLSSYPESPNMKQMRRKAENEGIPVLRPGAAALINVLAAVKKPKTALEIGTSIGYSSLVILNSMPEGSRLYTVEMDEGRYLEAAENFRQEGVYDRISMFLGDAAEILHHMEDRFDFIFLDGPKAQYFNYLTDCVRLLNPGGLLVCDDVLFYGMVARRELINPRKITIVKRLKKFLKAVAAHPELDTAIIPMGDGMSVSCKRDRGQRSQNERRS